MHQPQWTLLKFLIGWIPLTSAVGALSLVVPIAIISKMGDSAFVGDNGVAPIMVFGVSLVMITAPIAAVGQAASLLQLHPLLGGDFIMRWVPLTGLGFALGVIIGVFANVTFLTTGCGILLPGIFLGWMQALELRRHFRNIGWWVFVCAIGWITALLVTWAVGSVFPPGADLEAVPYYMFRDFLYLPGLWFVGMCMFQLATGLSVFQFREPVPQRRGRVRVVKR